METERTCPCRSVCGPLSSESHLRSRLSRPSHRRYQERYSRMTGANRRKNEATSLPDMLGGRGSLPDNPLRSMGCPILLNSNPLRLMCCPILLNSNQFKQFKRLALDWTKGCGQNLLVTWETEECSGARASRLKDWFVASKFPSPLSK